MIAAARIIAHADQVALIARALDRHATEATKQGDLFEAHEAETTRDTFRAWLLEHAT